MPSLAFGGTNQSQEARGYIQMPLEPQPVLPAGIGRVAPDRPVRAGPSSRSTRSSSTPSLGYAVQKWFRVEGYHSFTAQDNRVAGGEISRHVGGLQFVVSEPMRIR